jgi:hypothetical protein
MKIQGNYNRLLQIDAEFSYFQSTFPHVAMTMERITKFREKNGARIQSAKERMQAVGNKYIAKDENGQFRTDENGYVFALSESKEQFEKEIQELNQVMFDIIL